MTISEECMKYAYTKSTEFLHKDSLNSYNFISQLKTTSKIILIDKTINTYHI